MSRTPLSLNPSSTNTHGTATSAPRGQDQGRRREPRGFAAMDPEKQRAIASKGGKASGGYFKNDPARAAAAGRKGGEASGGNFAHDRARAAEAGRKGGQA